MLAIIAGIAATLIQARTERQQSDAALQERDRADRLTQFMTDIFKLADPKQQTGKQVTARELLDKASHEVEGGLALPNLAQATVLAGSYPEGKFASSTQGDALAPATASTSMLILNSQPASPGR